MPSQLFRLPDKVVLALFVGLLVVLCCSGIWSVTWYVNQDGTPHLYNAYLIVEILKGNEAIRQFASLNPQPVPNLTGHWLLALLLPLLGPAVTTKVMVTLTFGLFVASVVWLRVQVAGHDTRGIFATALFACVLGFNWLWFLGFYNFMLAAAGFAFTLGFWWKWRSKMTVGKAACLALLLALTFLSHLVSFGLLVAAIFVLLALRIRETSWSGILWTGASVVATFPLVFNYLITSRAGGGSFRPRWLFLSDAFSPRQWIAQLLAADPFSLIGRKSFPFVESTSVMFAAVTPGLWLAITLGIVAGAMLVRRWRAGEELSAARGGWLLLAVVFLLFWLVGPDDLGKSHGSYLRERTLILGLVCLIPWLDFSVLGKRLLTPVVTFLALILVFQIAVVWEYAARSDKFAASFLAAANEIGTDEAFGSILVMNEMGRFRSRPLTSITPLIGIGKNAPVLDNYEFGYYLFPVIATSPETRAFVYDFREANTFDLGDPHENVEEKKRNLAEILRRDHERFKVLLVWNDSVEFIEMRKNWFEEQPFYESGPLRLFRHR